MKSVCVVGAGPSGLVGAKTLLRTGRFKVTIFDKADRIGGIWALDQDTTNGFLPPETPTNLSKFTVGFSDLHWDTVKLSDDPEERKRVPLFPKAWQVNRYLETYRQKFIPPDIIKLGHEVIRAERFESTGRYRWRLCTRNREAQEQMAEFDYLMLASGFFASPLPIPGSLKHHSVGESLKAIHSSEFRKLENLFSSPEAAAGKKILVIGGGNSAGEVAAAVAQQISNANYAPQSGLQRPYRDTRIVHVTPRPLYALPPFIPFDESSTTFTALDLKLYDLSKRPPGAIVGSAGRLPKTVKDMIHGGIQGTIGGDQSDLGSPAMAIPASEPRSTVYAALSESYPEFVRSGLIEVVEGRVTSIEVEAGRPATASWVSQGEEGGKVDDIAAVIYATGYSPASAVDYLSEDVKEALQYDSKSQRLPLILGGWQSMASELPDLSLIGFYQGPYWPVMEMQARLTAHRWSDKPSFDLAAYERPAELLELRQMMQAGDLDVPQYWFGDYAGYMEEMSTTLGLHRNNGAFGEREGCVSPARYLDAETDRSQPAAVMQELNQVWKDCAEHGKYVARGVFRALQGNWAIVRTIDSALPSFPSGTLEGEASFHPRSVTPDKSGQSFDFEYLYLEHGTLILSNGASMPAKRRYVYRYSEARDELSVWFVKPDNDFEVDYLFHNFLFKSPVEARKEGACIANADHPCVDDMYYTEYRLPMKGIALHEFQIRHQVKGPSKDYVAITKYSRPSLK